MRNSFFSKFEPALGAAWELTDTAARRLLQSASGAVGQALGAGSPWTWALLLALGSPWLRIAWGESALYPSHWLLATVILLAFVHETARSWGGRGLEALPLRGWLLLMGYLALLLALRGEWPRAGAVAGATVLNFAWGWAAYQAGRHGERAEAAAAGVLLWVLLALGFEVFAWALAAYIPPVCGFINCPPWPEDPPRFRGGFFTPAQFALALALALPVLAPALLGARHAQERRERIALIALAAALGLAALAGGGAWVLPAGALVWWSLARAPGSWRDARDAAFLRKLGLWMAVMPVLFYAVFPGYLLRWFSLSDPPWSHTRIEPAGPAPRVLSSDRTTVYLLDLTNEGAFPLPEDAEVVPRLLLTPTRGTLLAHDLPAAPLAEGLSAHDTARVAVPVRLPAWVEEGFLSWQVRSPDGRMAPPSADSSAGMRFVNADFHPLADERENLLSAVAARARTYHEDTFAPGSDTPAGVNAEKIIGDILDTLIFSPLWGETKQAATNGPPFPESRPFLAQLIAEFGLIGLALVLRLGWITARRAELLGTRTTKAGARLSWPLVTAALGIIGVIALLTPAPGTFHGQWGLFLLVGFLEGRYDRLVPPQVAARAPFKSGVRGRIETLTQRLLGTWRGMWSLRPRGLPRLRWPSLRLRAWKGFRHRRRTR